MFNKIRYWWQDFVLRQFQKYYVIGGHCGLCGKWISDAIVTKGWEWTVCEESKCWEAET